MKRLLISTPLLFLLALAVAGAIVLVYVIAIVHVTVSPVNVSVSTVSIDLTGLKSGESFYRTADVPITVKNVYSPYVIIYADNLTNKDIFNSLNLTVRVDQGTPGTIDLLADGQFAQRITEGDHVLHLNLSGELGLVSQPIDDTFTIKMRLESGKK